MEKAALLALVLPAAFAGCLGGEPAPPVPTGQIDGAVVDQLLRPFGGQTVYLSELGLQDSTSPLGGFTFREVPLGSYTLLVTREGTRGAVAFVEVEQDKVTKVILQLMPLPEDVPFMSMIPHESIQPGVAFPGTACEGCKWVAHLDQGAPEEVVFEAQWAGTPGGHDAMRFEVSDDQGHVLYQSPVESNGPVSISIAGDDIPDSARSLTMQASFGSQFTPRLEFQMLSVVTLYYGATKAELFQEE